MRWTRLAILALLFAANLLPQGLDLVTSLARALRSRNSAEIEKLKVELLASKPAEDQLLAAGALLGQYDHLPEAAQIFVRCAELYPSSFDAKYNLALAKVGLSDDDGALSVLREMHPSNEDQQAATAYLTGKVYLDTNHLKEAQVQLAEANRLRPEDENYALDLGLLYVRSSAYELAVHILRKATPTHPDSTELRLELALADALAGATSEAIALCRELEKQDPANPLPPVISAFSYCATGDFAACEKEASAALARPHPHPYLYYLRARARWDAGANDAEDSISDLTNAIDHLPRCGVCFSLRSRLYEATHNEVLALADGKRAVDVDPLSASAWYRLSILERKAGQPQRAESALQHYRAIQDNKATEDAESFLSQVLTGQERTEK